jgi:hypothetical protein
MDAAAGTSARLAVLSCRRFYGYWSVVAGRRFHLPAAKSTRFDDFRLKSRPALITEELQSLVPWSLTGVAQQRTGEAHGFASSKLSVLRKHPIFADLEPEAFEQLCRYAKHSTLKRGATR